MRLAKNESDARTHRTPKALRAKFMKTPSQFRKALGVRARPRVAFLTTAALSPVAC
jgi:hypothetical protein